MSLRWEKKAQLMCLILMYLTPFTPKNHARKWEPCLTPHAHSDSPGEGGDPNSALPHWDAPLPLPPLWGAVGYPKLGSAVPPQWGCGLWTFLDVRFQTGPYPNGRS